MKAVLVCVLLGLSMSALALDTAKSLKGRLQAKNKWDVYGDWHMGGVTHIKKDKLHEELADRAVVELCNGPLGGGLTRQNCLARFDRKKFKTGVRWNDMPTGNPNDFLNVKDFGGDFGSEDPHRAVWQSHYGCFQHIHAMAPSSTHNGQPIHFTNAEVKQFIENQMKYWWEKAIRFLNQLAANDNNLSGLRETWSHYIGHILHVFGDSYAPGHAVRGFLASYDGQAPNLVAGANGVANPLPAGHGGAPFPTAAATMGWSALHSECGYIIHFQGYGPQHNNEEHAETDHKTDGRANHCKERADSRMRDRLQECTIASNFEVLRAFSECYTIKKANGDMAQCTYAAKLQPIVAHHFRLTFPDALAGGTNKYMADPGLDQAAYTLHTLVYQDVINELHGSEADKLYVPVVAPTHYRWTQGIARSVPGGIFLCPPGITARTGARANTLLPFTDYYNPTSGNNNDAIVHVDRQDNLQV